MGTMRLQGFEIAFKFGGAMSPKHQLSSYYGVCVCVQKTQSEFSINFSLLPYCPWGVILTFRVIHFIPCRKEDGIPKKKGDKTHSYEGMELGLELRSSAKSNFLCLQAETLISSLKRL